jgi:hypothetical protein
VKAKDAVALKTLSAGSPLVVVDSIRIRVEQTIEGTICYTAVPSQKQTGHPSLIIFQFYIDGHPHDRDPFKLAFPPSAAGEEPSGKVSTRSMQSVSMAAPLTLQPGDHQIAVHGGAYQNAAGDTLVSVAHRSLFFLVPPATTS